MHGGGPLAEGGAPIDLIAAARRAPARVGAAWDVVAALAMVAAAAWLRFHLLDGRSFWLDEASTADAVNIQRWNDLLDWCRRFELAPLFFIADWWAGRHYGITDYVLRVPSAVAGTVAVWFAFRLGRSLAGRAVGVATAAALAFLFYGVWSAQDARPYAGMLLFVTAQAWYAHAAVSRGRSRDWLGFAIATALSLYVHFVALLPTIGLAVYILAAIGWERVGAAWSDRRLVWRIVAAADAAAIAVLLYMEWLRSLQDFIFGTADLSAGGYFGRLNDSLSPLAQVSELLQAFGLWGPVGVLVAVGAVRLVADPRGRARTGPLPLVLGLCGIPMAIFAVRLHAAALSVWPRYLSFLVPALVFVAAYGAEAVALGALRLVRRLRPVPVGAAWPAALATVLIAGLLLPGTVASYGYQKDDYRGAMRYVLANGSDRDVVIAVGNYSVWLAESLVYYQHEDRADVLVVWSEILNNYQDLRPRLLDHSVHVWLAIQTGEDPHGLRTGNLIASGHDFTDPARYSLAGLTAHHVFGVTLVRVADPAATTARQASTLLEWATAFQPALGPARVKLFDGLGAGTG